MNKETPKTLIERFGFNDAELTTPLHDKMLLWSLENIRKLGKLIPNYLGYKPSTVQAEFPIMGYNDFNIGFVDLRFQVKLDDEEKECPFVYVEIKPTVYSIGELIRQINFYRSHLDAKTTKFLVLTKTKGLKEVLASQDIYVYEFIEEEVA